MNGGSVVNQWQGADTGMGGKGDGKGATRGDLFHDQHACGFVQFETTVFFAGVHHQQSEFAALAHTIDDMGEILVLDGCQVWKNLFGDKLLGGRCNGALFVTEILRSKNVTTIRVGNKKLSTPGYFYPHKSPHLECSW